MISPELLRRYPFFGPLSDEQLKAVAMLADQESVGSYTILLEEGKKADTLYLLMEGSLSLFYLVEDERQPNLRKEFPVGDINPGEPFSISALIEPHVLTSSVRADTLCQVIRIDAQALKDLCEQDCDLGYILMKQIARAAMDRLTSTRIQLAAAWA
jgi:CRP/FNR family cyclic AMP-dependent transcriptional regulator